MTDLRERLARQKGLEPLAYCLEGSCSIQLSYWRVCEGLFPGPQNRENRKHGDSGKFLGGQNRLRKAKGFPNQ